MVSASHCPAAMEAHALSLPIKSDGAKLVQPRHRKRALTSALRLFLPTGTCMYRGHVCTAERVSDLVPREVVECVHAQLGRTSRGHLHLPRIRSNDHENARDTPMRRNRTTNRERTGSTVQVWSYTCESCLVPGEKCRGADAMCLQVTQMTIETQWTHGQWCVTPVARTTHRAADGVLIAVSMQRFSKELIVTHHVWHSGRLLGVRVKAGQGSAEVDTYFDCGYAPTEVSPAEVREKFGDNGDRMLRSLPKRTKIIKGIDATATVSKETYLWVGRAGSAAKVES